MPGLARDNVCLSEVYANWAPALDILYVYLGSHTYYLACSAEGLRF